MRLYITKRWSQEPRQVSCVTRIIIHDIHVGNHAHSQTLPTWWNEAEKLLLEQGTKGFPTLHAVCHSSGFRAQEHRAAFPGFVPGWNPPKNAPCKLRAASWPTGLQCSCWSDLSPFRRKELHGFGWFQNDSDRCGGIGYHKLGPTKEIKRIQKAVLESNTYKSMSMNTAQIAKAQTPPRPWITWPLCLASLMGKRGRPESMSSKDSCPNQVTALTSSSLRPEKSPCKHFRKMAWLPCASKHNPVMMPADASITLPTVSSMKNPALFVAPVPPRLCGTGSEHTLSGYFLLAQGSQSTKSSIVRARSILDMSMSVSKDTKAPSMFWGYHMEPTSPRDPLRQSWVSVLVR